MNRTTILRAGMAFAVTGILAASPVLAESEHEDEGYRHPGQRGTVINAPMTRRAPGSTSGSGNTVEANCGGPDYQGATANLIISQIFDTSTVTINVRGAVPNTVFTVLLRMAGGSPGDDTGANGTIGPNPMNGGGATPLLPGHALDAALAVSPPFPGTSSPADGFTTDAYGNADFTINLDFPVVGGAYPFQKASTTAVQALRSAGSTWPLVRNPAVIVNPADPKISGPFLLRVISHCYDQLSHGLSPAIREAWFDYP